RVILMAVGLGVFFILSVRVLQSNLLDTFAIETGGAAPDLVLIDVQKDQADGVRALAAPYLRQPPRLLPLMRARVLSVDGQRVKLPTPDAIRRQGGLTREFGLTYRDALQPNERVTAGEFWYGALSTETTP